MKQTFLLVWVEVETKSWQLLSQEAGSYSARANSGLSKRAENLLGEIKEPRMGRKRDTTKMNENGWNEMVSAISANIPTWNWT